MHTLSWLRERFSVLIITVIGCLTRATFPIMRGSSHSKGPKNASDNRNRIHPPVTRDELGHVATVYQQWLTKQPLSANTRRTYLRAGQTILRLFGCVREQLR